MLEAVIDGIVLGFCNKKDGVAKGATLSLIHRERLQRGRHASCGGEDEAENFQVLTRNGLSTTGEPAGREIADWDARLVLA